MQLMKAVSRKTLPRSVRNWLRSPLQSLQWARYELQAGMGWLSSVGLRDDWRFRSHPAAMPFAYHAQIDDPEQRREFDVFVSRCSPGMRLFDLGSHFGIFSLAALHYGGPTAEAIAVDPSPLAIRIVSFQAMANGVENRLHTQLAAAGMESGTTSMVAAGIESAGYFVPLTNDHPAAEQTRVPTVSVDELTAKFGRPTHLKIDVEGAEWSVLQGARATLEGSDAPVIFLELHNDILSGRGDDPAEVLELLQSWNYRVVEDDDHAIPREDMLASPVARLVAEPMR